MKNIPFYFYVDMFSVPSEDEVQQELRKEFKDWMAMMTKDNPNMHYDPSYFEQGYQYIGFVPMELGSTPSNMGAVQRNGTQGFVAEGVEEITLDFWNENIRNKAYNVAFADRDYGAQCGIDESTNVVTRARNQIFVLQSGFEELEDMLGDTIDYHNGIPLICVDSSYAYSLYGFTIRNADYSSVDGDEIPAYAEDFLIGGGILFKCEHTGHISQSCYRQEATDRDGDLIQMSTWHTSPAHSNLHNMIFADSEAAMNQGFVVCEVSGDYVKPHEQKFKPNAGYHKLERRWRCDNLTEFTIGVEVEKEDEEIRNDIGYKGLFDRTDWIKESDSSLDGSTGFELVSPVYDLFSDDFDKDIDRDPELPALIDATYGDNCGGHINIASRTYSPIQLFYGLTGFFPLLYSVWSLRVDNHYSKAMSPHKYFDNRAAINIKENVLEFRLVAAVKSVKNLMWRRDLVRIMVKNINKSEQEVLRMLLNERSKLHKHMKKVYKTDSRFMKKCNDFVRFAEKFNNVKLNPINWDEYNKKNNK